MKGFRLKRVEPVFFTSHLLFLGLSYCIYLAPHIAPSTFPYFGFLPIFYPLIVLMNLILLIILFFRRILYAIVFTILSSGLYYPLQSTYQFFGKESTETPEFKLLTFNGQYLRVPGYQELFTQEDADIVLLQEVYLRTPELNKIKKEAFPGYYHEKNSIIQVFSKFPIIEFKQIFSGQNGTTGYAAYADLDMGKDTIRVINVYLESMLIDKGLVKETVSDSEKVERNVKILRNKLTEGFLRHEKQIKELVYYIVNSPYPVLLAGDLNAVPYSYEYQQILYRLQDAYVSTGKSSGTSFHDFKYPLRLDYVFHSKEFSPLRYEVLRKVKLSDHYPVVATFKLH